MQGAPRLALVVGLLAAACDVGSTSTPQDAAPGSDGSTTSGLTVSWTSKPAAIPGPVDDKITIKSAKFRVDNLRVIGDAGDSQTTKNDFTADWKDGEEPDDVEFTNAPTGLYSRVAIQADGHLVNDSWEVKGTVQVTNGEMDFVIEDKDALNISLQIDKMLQPGHGLEIKLAVEFENALKSVDYETLDVDDGVLELSTNDAQMPAFRAKLLESIKIDSAQTL